ncbi:ribonuclease P protein component [soil metagenome]
MNHRLPRRARVRTRAEFDQVFKEGRRTGAPVLALHWYADAQPARLGLAVSRKVDRRAVGRNRIKRVLRECFRRTRATLPGGAYVLVARPAAAGSDAFALQVALFDALRRAGALPAPAVDGTMPGASPPPPTAPACSGE